MFYFPRARETCSDPIVPPAQSEKERNIFERIFDVAYQGRMHGLIIAAMRGVGRLTYGDTTVSPTTEKEQTLALLLQQNWFASLIGWSAGLHSQSDVIDHVRTAARLYLVAFAAED